MTDPNQIARALGMLAPEPVVLARPQPLPRPPRQRAPPPRQRERPLNRDQTMDNRYQRDVIARLADTEQRLSNCLQDKQDVRTQLEQRLTMEQLFDKNFNRNSQDRHKMLYDFFAVNQEQRNRELLDVIARISAPVSNNTNILSGILNDAGELNLKASIMQGQLADIQQFQRDKFGIMDDQFASVLDALGDTENEFTNVNLNLATGLQEQTGRLAGVFQGLPTYRDALRGPGPTVDMDLGA